jgi:hypothetical protein
MQETRSFIVSDISLDTPRRSLKTNETRGVRAFNQGIAMSKAQKGNKENKKPKADKNRVKGASLQYTWRISVGG